MATRTQTEIEDRQVQVADTHRVLQEALRQLYETRRQMVVIRRGLKEAQARLDALEFAIITLNLHLGGDGE